MGGPNWSGVGTAIALTGMLEFILPLLLVVAMFAAMFAARRGRKILASVILLLSIIILVALKGIIPLDSTTLLIAGGVILFLIGAYLIITALKPQVEADTPLAKLHNSWAANSSLFKPKYVALLGGILMIVGSFLPWVSGSLFSATVMRDLEATPDKPLTLVIGIIAVIGTLAAKERAGQNGSLPAAIGGIWFIGIAVVEHLLGYGGIWAVGPGLLLSLVGAILAVVFGYQHNPGAATEYSTPLFFKSWVEVWIKATTRPAVATFEAIANDPKRSNTRAYGWIFVATLAGIIINLRWPQATVELAIFLLLPALGLAISSSITHWLARQLGGAGTYSQLIYAYAAYSAPFLFIAIATMAFELSRLSYSLFVGLFIYQIVLQVIALKAVHQISWRRATVAMSGFFVLILGVAFVVLYIYLLPLRNLRFF